MRSSSHFIHFGPSLSFHASVHRSRLSLVEVSMRQGTPRKRYRLHWFAQYTLTREWFRESCASASLCEHTCTESELEAVVRRVALVYSSTWDKRLCETVKLRLASRDGERERCSIATLRLGSLSCCVRVAEVNRS